MGKAYDLKAEQMAGVGRNRMPAEARAVIGYLSMQAKCATLTEVARRFGRDITTLSKGVRRIAERVEQSKTESIRVRDLMA